ncbi:phosphonate ABC transporter ATP-binding protein [Pseudorhodoplanes sp.]|uniref:phosphonate ABC transporter ATP-binding protein n=1 Tax=Pseudorhodoplanes sp. TaxID=1934341 RepID=UPI003919B771
MIQTHGVEVTYSGNAQALKPCALRFEPGAFTVLLGASGAGKSTLLRALNGLVTPTGGHVEVEGIGKLDTRRRLQAHRRRTGMIFQQHQLIGRCTVLQNVLTGRLGYHSGLRTLLPASRSEKTMALEAIERVGLIDHALKRADQLSGGQQQRVGIARAMVQKPTLILADEPVASLDPATAERVLSLLHGICKSDGITAVVSLHQLDFARRYSDRIVALAQGAVVFDGPASRLGKTEVAKIYGSGPATADDDDTEPTPLKTGTYA